jgi:hypothetical protein
MTKRFTDRRISDRLDVTWTPSPQKRAGAPRAQAHCPPSAGSVGRPGSSRLNAWERAVGASISRSRHSSRTPMASTVLGTQRSISSCWGSQSGFWSGLLPGLPTASCRVEGTRGSSRSCPDPPASWLPERPWKRLLPFRPPPGGVSAETTPRGRKPGGRALQKPAWPGGRLVGRPGLTSRRECQRRCMPHVAEGAPGRASSSFPRPSVLSEPAVVGLPSQRRRGALGAPRR